MRIITRLDRHVAWDVIVPTVLAFMVYTGLLVMNGLFTLMEQVVVFGVSPKDAFQVLLMGIPQVAILTIPVSFLFGVLLAAGRMTSENELTALLAAGIPARRLYKPILALGVLLTGLGLYQTLIVIPKVTREIRVLQTEMFTSGSAIGRIQPNVFYDEIPNMLLFVGDIDSTTGNWQRVFIHRVISPDEEQLTLARRGRVVQNPEESDRPDDTSNAKPWILLEDVVNHTFLRDQPEKLQTSTIQTHAFRPEPETDRGRKFTYRLSLRELGFTQLVSRMKTGRDETDRALNRRRPNSREDRLHQRRLAGLELNRRMAIPAASISFALLALPLGIGVRAGSRGRGFLYSILVVLAYYILGSYGEFLVIEKGVPAWAGIWIPNLAVMLAAAFLSVRMGRWLGERQRTESLLGRLFRWIRQVRRARVQRRAREAAAAQLTGSIPIEIQRRVYGGGFPTLLDRHLFRRLLSPLFLVMLSTISLYIIGDLTNHMDDIARNGVSAPVVLAYYWNITPRALFDVLPFGLLISVITLMTLLERNQELTALKASGLSVYRMTVPMLLVAFLGVGTMWTLGEYVVPNSDARAEDLLNQIKGRTATARGSAAHRKWLMARDGRTFYRFLRFDLEAKILYQFSMYRIDSSMELRYSLFAPRVRYENGAWIADGGWFRHIGIDGSDRFDRISGPTEIGVTEGPSYFGQETGRPNELSQADLRQYIRELENSGYRPSALMVRWHQKFATPLSVVVLVLLALPYSLNAGGGGVRASTMQGVAIALILGIGYFIVLVPLFGKLGEAEFLPPIVGAWAPIGIGLLLAANRMTHIRT